MGRENNDVQTLGRGLPLTFPSQSFFGNLISEDILMRSLKYQNQFKKSRQKAKEACPLSQQ
jgi:hypothetical protein